MPIHYRRCEMDSKSIEIVESDHLTTKVVPESVLTSAEIFDQLKLLQVFNVYIVNMSDANADLDSWSPQIVINRCHIYYVKMDRHGIKIVQEWPTGNAEFWFNNQCIVRYTRGRLHIFTT